MEKGKWSWGLFALIWLWTLLGTGIVMAGESDRTPYGIRYGSPDTFAEFHGFLSTVYSDFEHGGERNNRADSSFDQHYFTFNALARIRHNIHVLGEIEFESSMGPGRYSDSGVAGLDFSLLGLDVKWNLNGLDLRGEWVKRRVDVTTATSLDAYGYYVQATYQPRGGIDWFNYVEPVLRHEILNPGVGASPQGKRERISVGANTSPYPHLKMGTEWQANNEDRNELDDDGFLITAVVDF